VHGQDAGTQNVDAVNLLVADDAYGPCRRLVLDDVAQGIALLFAELGGRMTAAAKTGRARQPRPASSQPASMTPLW